MAYNPKVTYWDYIGTPELLELQHGLEATDSQLAEDELHFIVVHQVNELWFKVILREIRMARDRLAAPEVEEGTIPIVVHHLRRVNEILRIAVDHWRVVETLAPQDFLAFRGKLGDASGFQSVQLREIEVVLGLETSERSQSGLADPLGKIEQAARRSIELAEHAIANEPEAQKVATANRDHGHAILDQIGRLRHEIEPPSSESHPVSESPTAGETGGDRRGTLLQALRAWLYRTPIQGSDPGDPDDDEIVERFVQQHLAGMQQYQESTLQSLPIDEAERGWRRAAFEKVLLETRWFLEANELGEEVGVAVRARERRIRAGTLFIESYRHLPLLAWPRMLLDTLVELEEQLVLFRFRHARMVERVIGRRVGTGGAGVDYLDKTTGYRIFRELWQVRTILVPESFRPRLRHPNVFAYAFQSSLRRHGGKRPES